MRNIKWSRSLRLFAPLFVLGLVGLGMYNAYTPVVRHQTVVIDKKMDKPLRIGMASDLHLGILFGARALAWLPSTVMPAASRSWRIRVLSPNIS